jgi:hypothetical protein
MLAEERRGGDLLGASYGTHDVNDLVQITDTPNTPHNA